MITAVVGHRGTGKTKLLSRVQFYVRSEGAEFLDLDYEIERKSGKLIREVFLDHGEVYFREMERQVFLELIQKTHRELYIILGAGFDLSIIPESVRILWVKRPTDLDGRIFLDRPRLDPDLQPLLEYNNRARAREVRYREKSDEVYLMPEGDFENRHQAMAVESQILTHQMSDIQAAITVLPEVISSGRRWKVFKDKFYKKGVSFFELRNDFLRDDQVQQALRELVGEKIVFSVRRSDESWLASPEFQDLVEMVDYVDLAWEVIRPSEALQYIPREKLILSLHDGNQFEQWFKFSDQAAHMKFAPEIYDFNKLLQYHEWQRADTENRSFLPRSPEARWAWYRLLQKSWQKINFVKEDLGSAGDQPSLFQWLMTPQKPQHFAAVLGDPVEHSFTPLEHSDFFSKRNMFVSHIKVKRTEWNEAFPVLSQLGLTYAAVTSPHKENAAKEIKTSLKAINTLQNKNGSWLGTSTDQVGFVELIEGVGMIAPLQKDIAIWGGGGVLEMIEKELPQGSFFSAREGKLRNGNSLTEDYRPKIIVWSAPRAEGAQMPPDEWKPAMVIDLNYKEDSLGREYAQACGANYLSGLVMFKAQAQAQRLFWQKNEESV